MHWMHRIQLRLEKDRDTVLRIARRADPGFDWNPFSDSPLNKAARHLLKKGLLKKAAKHSASRVILIVREDDNADQDLDR